MTAAHAKMGCIGFRRNREVYQDIRGEHTTTYETSTPKPGDGKDSENRFNIVPIKWFGQ